ncbi:transmembrane protein 269 [Egretta garzetta]|uniref:transmembrane protein 269 n=1 Tax=Egretta garzetta TaxID=188379 RepID=UPI00163C4533|nr:transmembrane protein 269 [Egretta garzetta]
MWMVSPPIDEGSPQLAWLWDHGKGIFQSTKKLFLSERAGRGRTLEFIRKNAANGLSVANLVAGLSSVLCSLNRQHHHSCWLLLVGFLLDLADGAVARQLDACSALVTGGNITLLRVTAIIMILFMVDRGFYPHDKVLESQLWKKAVYAGGVAAVLFLPAAAASVYCLAWSTSYIIFPFAIWSSKA